MGRVLGLSRQRHSSRPPIIVVIFSESAPFQCQLSSPVLGEVRAGSMRCSKASRKEADITDVSPDFERSDLRTLATQPPEEG